MLPLLLTRGDGRVFQETAAAALEQEPGAERPADLTALVDLPRPRPGSRCVRHVGHAGEMAPPRPWVGDGAKWAISAHSASRDAVS